MTSLKDYRDAIEKAEATGVPAKPAERHTAVGVLTVTAEEIDRALWQPDCKAEAREIGQRFRALAGRIDAVEREREVAAGQ